ncbi:LacI family DNA-binding transcriptional regulator [Nocardioides sp.]|uniref:LacI family DNA-binding transcriptional regulator n=1 Tax=Nocardioides sp. TaxID=35761 RepID=UPI0027367C11|nr:LacI family DNA-binding transcriptional regulator [Nocardioides sp.]MDP3891840.1 LacI family DNA-binding transcriptional regulator [Nocardioides sp.]
MADIAEHLGVSRQLVSIALRDMPGASDATRARVKQAAKELGYSPHQGARLLRQYRRRQIGVAFAPAHATEPDIVESIYSAVASHRLQVVLSAQTRTRTTEQAVEELLEYRCAALIVIGPELDDVGLRDLAKRARLPLVAVDQGPRNTVYDVVSSAGDVGIELLVRHLLDLGHRRLAYLDAPAMPPAANRLEGYLRAIGTVGLKSDIISIDTPDYTEEAGARAGRELLERDTLPTAVLACNDQVAVGALQVLSRAGVSVPADVSLTGFDDSRFASLSSVDLTTARQDPDEMGKAAVDAAVRRISKPAARPALHVVQPTLVVRGSTAPIA